MIKDDNIILHYIFMDTTFKLFEGLLNLKNNKYNISYSGKTSTNKMNAQGDQFEEFVAKCIAGATDIKNQDDLKDHMESVFSYTGNSVNPPDLILKNGPAIEIKHTKPYADIQLNSSYPKIELFQTDPSISKKAAECENYVSKKFWYVLGNLKGTSIESIESITFLESYCYFAKSDIYEAVFKKISSNIASTSTTRELGRIGSVDPSGVTSLRIRSMWLAVSPLKHFAFLEGVNYGRIICMKSTYDNVPTTLKNDLEKEFEVDIDYQIPNPNDPTDVSKRIEIVVIEGKI